MNTLRGYKIIQDINKAYTMLYDKLYDNIDGELLGICMYLEDKLADLHEVLDETERIRRSYYSLRKKKEGK
jgi:hypothetical protein